MSYVPRKLDILMHRWHNDASVSDEDALALFAELAKTNLVWRMPQSLQRDFVWAVDRGLVRYDGPIPPHARAN